MNNTSITENIISAAGAFDDFDGGVQYYDAVLAINTDKFKIGDVVDVIAFNFEAGTCTIYQGADAKIPQATETFPIRLIKG